MQMRSLCTQFDTAGSQRVHCKVGTADAKKEQTNHEYCSAFSQDRTYQTPAK